MVLLIIANASTDAAYIQQEKDGKFILTKKCKVGNNVTECNLFAASSCLPGLCTGNWLLILLVTCICTAADWLLPVGESGAGEGGIVI